jgi:hypothetical protein
MPYDYLNSREARAANRDSMSTLEALIRIAEGQGEVFDALRAGIGVPEIAILIGKEVLKDVSIKMSATGMADVLKLSESGVRKKIDNTAVKANSSISSAKQRE